MSKPRSPLLYLARTLLLVGSSVVPAGRIVAQTPALDWMSPHWLGSSAEHAMVYDVARQRVVMFANGTWEWEGTRWIQATPATSPPGRFGHALAYDSARRRVVLFGGCMIPNEIWFRDTWEWDGANWSERTPASSPSERSGHAMAYDAARQRVVLFGGLGASDTWEWDGTAWLQRTPATHPPGLDAVAMAYDSARQRVVLFGGDDYTRLRADTWEWDGTIWLLRSPATSPPARHRHAMAYDATRQRVVLFGGAGPAPLSAPQLDTWEWDGNGWSLQSPATSPPARHGHALAFDAARKVVVLFGGEADNGVLPTDTWQWDGTQWTEQRLANAAPRLASGSRIAYDSARQRVVSCGGNTGATWEWDGVAWVERKPATSPPARSFHAVAYDAARQRIVLFGGLSTTWTSDTWEYDGTTWLLRSPATSPPARHHHALAYDAARQRVVLFGGNPGVLSTSAGTWEWDGTTWTQRSPATSPPARESHAMAYDETHQRVVLFGGRGVAGHLADTWEWDGTTWLQRAPAANPSRRHNHALAYDSSRQVVVLNGGSTSDLYEGDLNDTWEWDGTTWAKSPAKGGPIAFHSMAYDAARRRVVRCAYSGFTSLYGSILRAAARPLGTACLGSNGPPLLTSTEPWLGNPAFLLDLLSARPAAPCAVFLSDRRQSLALPGGCTVYVDGVFVMLPGLTNAAGFASTSLAIPFDSALRGSTLYAQAAVVDPQAPITGLALSAGRALVLGD